MRDEIAAEVEHRQAILALKAKAKGGGRHRRDAVEHTSVAEPAGGRLRRGLHVVAGAHADFKAAARLHGAPRVEEKRGAHDAYTNDGDAARGRRALRERARDEDAANVGLEADIERK